MTAANFPASSPDRATVRVRLRPTMTSDLEFVLSLEQDPENLPFITPWERTQHEAAIRFPDFRHFIIEGGPGLDAVGFLILIGCRSQHQSLELKRMVVQAKGSGYRPRGAARGQEGGLRRPGRAPLLARREGAQHAAPRRCTTAKASWSKASCAKR